jgi:hypothetical protein
MLLISILPAIFGYISKFHLRRSICEYKFTAISSTKWCQDNIVSIVTSIQAGQSGIWIPVGARDFPLLQNVRTRSGTPPPASCSMGTCGSFCRGESRRSKKLTTNLHLVTRLRLSGGISPLPFYAFMACTGTTLPLPFSTKYNKLVQDVTSVWSGTSSKF